MLFFNSGAQEVESSAYNLVLRTLLSHSVPEISAQEAYLLKDSVLFIDSREINEYNVSHIKNALWLGYEKADLSALEAIEKNQKIIVYCSVGYRSEKIAEQLLQEGFKDVVNLYGGIFEWKNKDFPIINTQGEKTDSIHAYSKTWGIWLKKGEKVY
jgi:rhodanese-related sulfurtransferase